MALASFSTSVCYRSVMSDGWATPGWASRYEPLTFDQLRATLETDVCVPERSAVALAAVCLVLVPMPPSVLTAWRTMERAARELHAQVAQLVSASFHGRYPFAAPLEYHRHHDLALLNHAIRCEQKDRVLERPASWLSLAELVVQQAAFARFLIPIVEDTPRSEGNENPRGVQRLPGSAWVPLRDPDDTSRPWMDLLVAELVKVLVYFGTPMPTKQGERRIANDVRNAFEVLEEILGIVLPQKDRDGLTYDAIRLRHTRGAERAEQIIEQVIHPDFVPGAKYRTLSPIEWVDNCASGFAGEHAQTYASDGRPLPAGCIWVPRRDRHAD